MQVSNISFGKIYQVVGPKKSMREFRTLVDKEQTSSGNKAFVYNAADIIPSVSETAKKLAERDHFFVLTGEDYDEEIRNNERSSLQYLLGCTDKIICVSQNVKREAFEVLQAIKENL